MKLLLASLVLTLLVGCNQLGSPTPPEVVGTTAEAVSAPWICVPQSYNPYDQPFVLGFCQWKPNQFDGSEPAGISFCTGATPQWAIDIYSSTSLTGGCARVSILAGRTLSGNSQEYTTLNGWHVKYPNQQAHLMVRSWSLGAHTEAIFCDTEPGFGFSCPTGIGVGNSAGGPVVMNDWSEEGRTGFEMAAFEILHF